MLVPHVSKQLTDSAPASAHHVPHEAGDWSNRATSGSLIISIIIVIINIIIVIVIFIIMGIVCWQTKLH